MKRGFVALVLGLCALFLADATLNAQVAIEKGNDLSILPDQLIAQGWQEVTPGLLQRQRPGQPVEILAFGPEGLTRALQEVRGRYGALLEIYKADPKPEIEQALGELQNQAIELEQTIAGLRTDSKLGSTENLCNFSFGCGADAYPLSYTQGVGAHSSAYFYNDCSYNASVYAEAYGYTNGGGTGSFQWQSDNGSNVSKSASISVGGSPTCYSSAYSYVSSSSLSLFYSCSDYNYDCPVPTTPPSVYISAPSYVYVYGYNCETVTWYAVPSGGTPSYSYSWTVGGYSGGTGSSTSMTYCGSGYTYNDYVNVSVTVTDSASQQASAGFWTDIYYQGSCYYYLESSLAFPVEPCYMY